MEIPAKPAQNVIQETVKKACAVKEANHAVHLMMIVLLVKNVAGIIIVKKKKSKKMAEPATLMKIACLVTVEMVFVAEKEMFVVELTDFAKAKAVNSLVTANIIIVSKEDVNLMKNAQLLVAHVWGTQEDVTKQQEIALNAPLAETAKKATYARTKNV